MYSCTIILDELQKILWFEASVHLPYLKSFMLFIIDAESE